MMKNLFAALAIFTIMPSFFSQDITAYELANFDQLIVIGNFPVEVINSDQKEAIVDKKDSKVNLSNLSFSYSQKVLTIKYNGSFVEEIGISVKLYHSGLISMVEARRGAQIKINDAGTHYATVNYKADSGGKLTISNVVSPLVKALITKGGSISITGETPIFEPIIKTGGTVAAARLISNEVNAYITFGGEIICAPIELLNANVTSGGTINYTGNPKVTEKITLGGTIEKI